MRIRFANKMHRGVALVAAIALSLAVVGAVPGSPAFAASDGAGTMTVSPNTVGAGETGLQLSFVFTNNSSTFSSSSNVTVVVPSNWTPASSSNGQPGYVTASGSCNSLDTTPSVSGSGPWTITIAQRCTNGQSFTLLYGAGSSATHVTAPSALGVSTFTTQSRDGFSGGSNLAVQPTVTVGPGAVNSLVYGQQPTNVVAGISMTPAVTVTAKDAFNNLVPNATVTLTPQSGTIAAGATATTNSSGVATFSGIQINTAATGQKLTATSGTGSVVSNAFNVTAGTANKLVFVGQPPSTVTAGTAFSSVTVQVTDSFGNPVATSGANVTLAPSVGSINSGASATTGSTGLATFAGITINAVNSNVTLSASSTSPSLSSGAAPSTSFNVVAGTVSSLTFSTLPASVVAGSNIASFTVTAKDGFNNPINNAAITLSGSPSAVTAGLNANTNASGVATFATTQISTVATGEKLTATSGSASVLSSAFNVTPGIASKLAFVQQPSIESAGVAMTPAVTVQVTDANGNAVASNNLPITLAISAGSIASGATANTNSSGLATFSGLTINTAGSSLTLTASAAGPLTSLASNAFAVTAGAANKLGFGQQPPSSVVAGVAMSPAVTVQVQDQFGNPVNTSGVSITLTPSAGVINAGATASTNGSGLASFPVAINTAATGLSLTAASTTPALASGSSTTFAVIAAAQKQLVWVLQPSNVTAGSSMSTVSVRALDQFGNPVSTSGTLITLAPSSGSINSGATANTASGLATFNGIQINAAATGLTLTASGSGLTSTVASSSFNVTAGTASKLAFQQGPSNVVAGVSMSPAVTVRVQDSLGNTVLTDSGRTVTLGVSSGTINAGNSTTTSGGIATFSGVQINTVASGLTLTSLSSGLTTTPASSAFNVTVAPASKLAFAVQPQDTTLGVAITPAVTVQVQDQFNNLVTTDTGRTLTLTPSAGPIAGNTASTSGGVATFSGITINTANEGLTLTASAPGLTASAASLPFTVAVQVANGASLTAGSTVDVGSGVATVSYYYCAGYTNIPVCTSSNGTLIGSSSTAAGNYPVLWNAQPPNNPYRVVIVATDNVTNTSSASASIPVKVLNQQSQTITFTSTPPAAGTAGSGNHTYTVLATASSGLTVAITLDGSSTGCTLAGAVVTFTGAGTCVVDANQAGNALFTAAPQVQQSITALAPLAVTGITSTGAGSITPGTSSQTITFNNALNPATVPTSGTMTFSTGQCIFVCGNTTLSVPGLTSTALDTASQGWVAHANIFGVNTIAYGVTVTLSGDHKSITMTVGSCTANCTNTAAGTSGTYKFIPVSSIADIGGDGGAAEFDVPGFLVF